MRKLIPVSRRARSIARWSLLAVFCIAVLTACANRGMMAVMGSGGAGGDNSGSGGSGSGGDGTGGSGSGGGGVIGTGGAPAVDSSADATDARDASSDHACPTTAATFNFESGVQGAHLGAMTGAAISVTTSTANHYCGQHSLEVTTTFNGTSGNTTKAEVLIDLPANLQNLSGKTITIHVAVNPDAMSSAYLALTLRTAVGDMTIPPSVRPLTGDWQTQTYQIPNNDGGTTMVTSLAFQMFDTNNYQGKLYIDDVDIH